MATAARLVDGPGVSSSVCSIGVSGTFLLRATTLRSMRGPVLRTSRGPHMNTSLWTAGRVATNTDFGRGPSGLANVSMSAGSVDSRNSAWLFEPRM